MLLRTHIPKSKGNIDMNFSITSQMAIYIYMYVFICVYIYMHVNSHPLTKEGRSLATLWCPEGHVSSVKEQYVRPLLKRIPSPPL